jgi:hypothetical protein
MSHRRWRQSLAPGASPGSGAVKNNKPSKRATESCAAPTGLLNHGMVSYPGLTPGAINMPLANAGSSSDISADASKFTILSQFPNIVSIMIAHRERT